jgi:hypothetical protein
MLWIRSRNRIRSGHFAGSGYGLASRARRSKSGLVSISVKCEDKLPDFFPDNFNILPKILTPMTLMSSLADPGCLSRIPDPDFTHPGSRIPDPKTATKERSEKKLVVITFYVATNFTKLKIILVFTFQVLKKKIWANFQRNYRTFYPKIVIKLSKIWVWSPGSEIRDPGSGKTYSRSGIQGSKRHRIPDPDPQHC